jgi:hypothetical protein
MQRMIMKWNSIRELDKSTQHRTHNDNTATNLDLLRDRTQSPKVELKPQSWQ